VFDNKYNDIEKFLPFINIILLSYNLLLNWLDMAEKTSMDD